MTEGTSTLLPDRSISYRPDETILRTVNVPDRPINLSSEARITVTSYMARSYLYAMQIVGRHPMRGTSR